MNPYSMPTKDNGCSLDKPGKPAIDERRGFHLLSPGDVVRFGSTFWDVTGVELHTATDCDCVTLRRVGTPYKGEPESRVPLRMIERGTVYLRAEHHATET